MMMTGRAFSTATKSTPAGLLTEAEVWCKISDLAARIKETGEKTSVLFSALRGGLVGSVMGPGSTDVRLPKSESATIRTAALRDSNLGINVLHSYIMNECYHDNARESIIHFTESQVAQAKSNMLHAINNELNVHGHSMLPTY